MELNELLNKVSEEDLAKAVGGLTQRNKNLLIGAVALLAGTAAGIGGKLAYDKWGSKKDETASSLDPGVAKKVDDINNRYSAIIKDTNKSIEERLTAARDYYRALAGLNDGGTGATPLMKDDQLREWIESHDKAKSWDRVFK